MNLYDASLNWLENHTLPCPFRMLTGCDCPGCGMQRSILLVFKGKISESFDIHPAGIPMLLLFVFILVNLKLKLTMASRIITLAFIAIGLISITNYMLKLLSTSY